MEKYLRPARLDGGTTGDQPDKLQMLTNLVSHSVFEYIADCTTYEAAIAILQDIYVQTRNEVFSCHQLASRRQQTGETVDQFLQALRLRAKDCNFRTVSSDIHAQESIRDAFISGLSSALIRQRLLENRTLNLNDAFSQARALDAAQKNANSYNASESFNITASTSHADIPEPSLVAKTDHRKCFFCGNSYHHRTKCPAKDATCHKCGKNGHFSKVCKSSPFLTKRSASTSNESVASIHILGSICSLHKVSTTVVIKGVNLSAMIDSGSTESFISSKVAKTLNLRIYPSNTVITMASSSLTDQTIGHCKVNIHLRNQDYKGISLMVLPNLCSEVLLGQDFMNLHECVSFKMGGSLPHLSICNLTVCLLQPCSPFTNLSPECKPLTTPSRRFSTPDQAFIKSEIESMLREGIVEPSTSPWRAQVHITTNERHKKRLVIDYSRTINRFTLLDAYPIPRIEDLTNKIANYTFFSAIDLKSAYHQIPLAAPDRPYTAFEANGQLLQFRRLPFGLTNAVSCFQRTIHQFIESNSLEATFAYLDDVIICGKTLEEHDHNLELFTQASKRSHLTLNNEKCKIRQTSINFLGYTITNGTLRPDAERLEPLRNLQEPKDTASLKRCIGMFSYYSRWIPHYSEKVLPLASTTSFPIDPTAQTTFCELKSEIEKAVLTSIDESLPFVVETDASDTTLAATLSQAGRPVAFFSRSLTPTERNQSAIEKEAAAIIETVRKWRHYLCGRHFSLITDQQAISFMFDTKHNGKIKNEKICRWRLELSGYSYDIVYRPGAQNVSADALSRACSITTSTSSLTAIHEDLCHPGIQRLLHFVKAKNLPFSTEEVKSVCLNCKICCEMKPRFYRPPESHLIKATTPFERLSMDYVGPKSSTNQNKYLLVLVDEHSRFPFVFPCSDISAATVTRCLSQLFNLFGLPSYIHSDRGAQFMSSEVRQFLLRYGIAQSRTTPYNPRGNGQCERYNGTIWRTILLALRQKNLDEKHWQTVLPTALLSVRSLICTSTNSTPHERFFCFSRRSSNGVSMPTWLTTPGPVLLRRHVRQHKSEPLVDEVELLHTNPTYAYIRHSNGRESSVSLRDLAPIGHTQPTQIQEVDLVPNSAPENVQADNPATSEKPLEPETPLRRSTRQSNPPDRYSPP